MAMTEQEAIKVLNLFMSDSTELEYALTEEFAEAIGACKRALKKRIPKKPELIEGKMYTCPCCDNNLMHKWLKYPTELMPLSEGLPYCMACGQKIDWGNEDDRN